MSKPKPLWLTISAIIVCLGCCSLPLYALLVGSAGLTVLWNGATTEIVKCALPLAILGIGYWIYQKRQAKKRCCTSPQEECGSQRCATQPRNNR